ncbi:MAG: acetyltransferase-like isoleucine patch superfamily enzyme [Arenicella sp.]|jgi:acetyltransferase-like isoleucine patch superfamily enzyme
MLKNLIKLIYRKLYPLPNYDKYIEADSSVIKDGLSVEVRNHLVGKKHLKIGSGSVVSGRFVIEQPEGMVSIGRNSFIGGGTFISIENIAIGNDVMISWGCTVMDNNAHSLVSKERQNDVKDWARGINEGNVGKYKDWSNVKSGKITIKDAAWIGFNCIILKGVTIGKGAVVGSGSVVTKDVPDYNVVAGNPATFIRLTE